MDIPQVAPWALWSLFTVVAVSLLLAGYRRVRARRVAPARIAGKEAKKMLSLRDAAAAAYQAAKKEGMIIGRVAERADGDAAWWFALSIAGVVPVYQKSAADDFEKLAPGTSVGLQAQSLYIRKQDYQTYLRWARSMQ
jgi:hypothetical protein